LAALSKTGSFYKTVKQVSVTAIGREAERPVRLLVAGAPEAREEVQRELIGVNPAQQEPSIQQSLLFFDSTALPSGFPQSLGPDDIVIDLGGGLAPGTSAAHYYNVEELGGLNRVIERLLDMRPDLWLALGRRFPGLRRRVSERIVHETATTNAEWAMLNALPGVIPLAAWLLPTAAIGDIFLLTKNQVMMMYRLAAAHGLPLDLRARSRDLAPLLGSAFGWRAIARELVAVVPGGIGMVARGAFAYAGTAALGRATTLLYQTGRQASRAQISRFYKDAYAGARRIAAERLHLVRSKRPALLAATADEEETEPRDDSSKPGA
jgi:uncharacterized protein (DUF697 family)